MPARAPGRGESLPPIDERLAVPETHTQVIDGVVVETMGANPPHAVQHAAVTRVFADCLAQGWEVAVDMLTRVDRDNDRAADVSVFPAAPDPKTGGRQLEELVFEICDSQRDADVTRKARAFALRGVRRVFHVRVDDGGVFEWRRDRGDWRPLDANEAIEDRCFVVPIPARALVERVRADDTIARALLAMRNPVLVAAVEDARNAGKRDGRDEGLGPLVHQFARKLARPLRDEERARLRERLASLGAARLGDVVIDLTADELAAWLAADDAR